MSDSGRDPAREIRSAAKRPDYDPDSYVLKNSTHDVQQDPLFRGMLPVGALPAEDEITPQIIRDESAN